MGTAWEWLDDSKTIALVSLDNNWTRDDLASFTSDLWPYMRQQPHTVDVVVDLRRAGFVPMQPITSLIWLGQNRPENAGRVVFVVKRTLGLAIVRALNHTIQRLYPKFELSAALTLEESLRLLRSPAASKTFSSQAQAGNQSPSEFPR